MANVFTEIRKAIEGLFVGRMEAVVNEVLKFDAEYARPFDQQTRAISKWLRIDPAGGPIDPRDMGGSWKITRRFLIVFAIEARNMDAAALENIERAALGCIALGVESNLGLDYVRMVRATRWECDLFTKKDPATKEETEQWMGVGLIEVDIRVLKTELATWAPDAV